MSVLGLCNRGNNGGHKAVFKKRKHLHRNLIQSDGVWKTDRYLSGRRNRYIIIQVYAQTRHHITLNSQNMYITFNFNSVDEILSLAAFAFSLYSVYICIQNHREINRQIKKHENRIGALVDANNQRAETTKGILDTIDKILDILRPLKNRHQEQPGQNKIPGHPNPPPPPTKWN